MFYTIFFKEIVRDARPGLAVECETLDLATADKVFFRNYFYQ